MIIREASKIGAIYGVLKNTIYRVSVSGSQKSVGESVYDGYAEIRKEYAFSVWQCFFWFLKNQIPIIQNCI